MPQMPNTIETHAERISSRDIEGLATPLNLNGILYMPRASFDPETYQRIGRKFSDQPWFKALGVEKDDWRSGLEDIEFEGIINDGDIMIESHNYFSSLGRMPQDEELFYDELGRRLVDAYVFYKYENNGKSPEWFALLDPATQRTLSFQEIWNRQTDFPPYFRFAPMLYSGVNCFVMENVPMYEELNKVFNLSRLAGIKQFGYKQDPLTTQHEIRMRINSFNHQRYRHVFSVLALANLLGTNAGLSQEDLRLLQIAGVTHDYRTPAGGDTTKIFVDPEIFDEDKHYNEIFETKEWKEFAEKHGITKAQEEKLYRAIQGEGVLGKLLDIADKVAYVCGDVDMYLNAPDHMAFFREGENTGGYDEMGNPGFQAIKSITKSDLEVCSLWDSIEITEDKVIIADSERLARFLKLRALMFRELYMSRYSRFFFEMFVGKVTKHLWDEGILTEEILLATDDGGLNSYLGKFVGLRMFLLPDQPKESSIENFSNVKEAIDFARRFNDTPDRIAMVDDIQVLPDSGTRKFLVRKKGKVLPFNEAFPTEAGEIDEIIDSIRQINVYLLSLNDLKIPQSHRDKVKQIFRIESSPA